MEQNKFTAGQWEVIPARYSSKTDVLAFDICSLKSHNEIVNVCSILPTDLCDNKYSGHLPNTNVSVKEAQANAKLISASPKMIEFIGKVMSKLQEHQKEDKKIIAGYTLAANIDGFTDLLNEAGEIWRSALSWSE